MSQTTIFCFQLGNTALHIACREGLVEIVQLLCAHKADTALQNNQVSVAHNGDIVYTHRYTSTHCCCISCIFSLSLSFSPSLPPPNLQKGRTPLHLACVGEHVEVAKCVALYDPSSLHGIDKVQQHVLIRGIHCPSPPSSTCIIS